MRVLMTTDPIGGAWWHAIELADALHREGVRTVLAALGRRPTAEQAREAAVVPGLRLHSAPLQLPWMEEPWDDIAQAGEWLLRLAADEGVDLVHLSEPVLARLSWATPVVAVGHWCVLSWYRAVRGAEAPAEWERYRKAMCAGLAAADAVVAPSSAMLRALERYYGVTGGTVVPNGRDAASCRPVPKEPIVLTVGKLWDPAQNLGLLAAVARDLAWPVYVAGDPRPSDGCRPEETGNLHLLGALGPDAMADAFARAGIYALPARYEAFGQSVIDAALAGCALVLGDIPNLRELWDSAALFVPPDDPTGLRAALTDLIRNPRLRRDLGADARRRALEYSPERMARGYLTVYDRIRSLACAS